MRACVPPFILLGGCDTLCGPWTAVRGHLRVMLTHNGGTPPFAEGEACDYVEGLVIGPALQLRPLGWGALLSWCRMSSCMQACMRQGLPKCEAHAETFCKAAMQGPVSGPHSSQSRS